MEEINLMKKFAHPNIVGLLGMYSIMITPALVYMYNTLCKATIMYMYMHAFILVALSPVSLIMQHWLRKAWNEPEGDTIHLARVSSCSCQ